MKFLFQVPYIFLYIFSQSFSYLHYTDPAFHHLPNIITIDGLMNLLSACVLVVLGNVLDFRTYRAPTQEVNQKANDHQQILIDSDINTIPVHERFAMCYSRWIGEQRKV
jgi:hypothetical protein